MAKNVSPFKSASSQMPALTLSVGQLFIQSQLCTKPQSPPKDLDLSGQTAIITGANNGIGFACAKLLLQHNLSHLIIAVRSEDKGNAAAEQLRRTTASASPQIDVWRLDMGDYSSVEGFAKRCETLPRIDFVILNAGMGDVTFHLNKTTGHEETMQVNFLSTMYLSVILLPILKSRAPTPKPGRLTIVSSGTTMHCELPEAKADHIVSALDSEANFDGMGHYGKSKLLGQLFIDRLSQRIDPNDVIINLVDPGLTRGTGLMNKGSWLMKIGMAIGTRLVGRTQEQAASSYVDAAIIKGEETHGSYIMDWKIYPYVLLQHLLHQSLTDPRFGLYYYTEEGKSIQDRIWREVMDEFAFARMEEILRSLKQ
ncbi:WW domain-containing oxidoreductase [Fusarium acutatum]|uniref:WW domain-containing oxidoreductase n=1 Tax=Fusarium acutatum TaxID=78861 RepID=A0A8H4JDK9_9HYPO|nr:WW domain-containing oxidoreductase [Fusarium acutatum]